MGYGPEVADKYALTWEQGKGGMTLTIEVPGQYPILLMTRDMWMLGGELLRYINTLKTGGTSSKTQQALLGECLGVVNKLFKAYGPSDVAALPNAAGRLRQQLEGARLPWLHTVGHSDEMLYVYVNKRLEPKEVELVPPVYEGWPVYIKTSAKVVVTTPRNTRGSR